MTLNSDEHKARKLKIKETMKNEPCNHLQKVPVNCYS